MRYVRAGPKATSANLTMFSVNTVARSKDHRIDSLFVGDDLSHLIPRQSSTTMYAIETKKRKFDRILETIKDHANPQPQPPTTPPCDGASSITLAENSSMKKRRVNLSNMSSKNSSATSLPKTANYLPASREAFLERLETFGPISRWHVPSTEDISAVAWAKRGWWCIGTDMVACKACNEQLLVKLDEEEEAAVLESSKQDDEGEDDFDNAATLRHQLMVEKYSDLIITGHAFSCPWRNRGCDASIQRISGLFNTTHTVQTVKARYDSLSKFDVPTVHISSEDFSHPLEALAEFRFSTSEPEQPDQDTLRLAICGWQASPDRQDVAECRACFRSLGLWMYRGESPIVEKLDAVESHLEYCPWRSSDAQRTEIDLGGKKMMVPAWVLVGGTIKNSVHRPLLGANAMAETQQEIPKELAGKERETKVKELLRRVKDLKKPFNVRALLRKKPPPS